MDGVACRLLYVSLWVSAGHDHEPCTSSWADRDSAWNVDSGKPDEQSVKWEPWSPTGFGDIFEGNRERKCAEPALCQLYRHTFVPHGTCPTVHTLKVIRQRAARGDAVFCYHYCSNFFLQTFRRRSPELHLAFSRSSIAPVHKLTIPRNFMVINFIKT